MPTRSEEPKQEETESNPTAGSKRSREESEPTEAAAAEPAVEQPEVEVEMPALPVPPSGEQEASVVATAADAIVDATAEAAAAAVADATAEAAAAAVADAVAASAEADEPKAKRTRLTWNDRFEQLKAYKAEHGHCNINIRYPANPTLGKWVNNQREQYKVYVRKKALEAAGIEEAAAATTEEVVPKTEDGAELVPKPDDGGDASAIAALAAPTKKPGKKKRSKCPMNDDRIYLLESIGFAWSTNREKQFDDGWNRRLEELKAYKAEHGDCLVPHGYGPSPALAEWVHRQRCTYVSLMKDEAKETDDPKEKANRDVARKRMDILKDLGFAFRVKADTWSNRLEELRTYRAQHGDCAVPINYAENPTLGRWVHTQRHQYKLFHENRQDGKRSSRSSMTPERMALLEAEGFSWEVRAVKGPKMSWEQRYNELKEFREREGHCRVPADQAQLNRWCNDQRTRLKALQKDGADADPKMGPERVEALAALGFTATSS